MSPSLHVIMSSWSLLPWFQQQWRWQSLRRFLIFVMSCHHDQWQWQWQLLRRFSARRKAEGAQQRKRPGATEEVAMSTSSWLSSPSVWSHGHHRRSWRGGSFCLRGTGSTGRGRQHQLPLSGWLTTSTSSSSLTSSPSWTSSSSCQSLISSSSSTQCHCEDINNINCHWHITSIALCHRHHSLCNHHPCDHCPQHCHQTDKQQQGHCLQASTSRPVTERRIQSTRTFRPRARPDNFVTKSWNSKNDDDDNLQTNKMLWKPVRPHRRWEDEYLSLCIWIVWLW